LIFASEHDNGHPGPRDPVVWFGAASQAIFAQPIKHYVSILITRVVPIFDDLDGEEQRAADAVLNARYWNEENYHEAIEAAIDHSRDHILEFMELRSVFLTTGVVGLFHLFEKQLLRHLNHELAHNLFKEIKSWKEASEAIDALNRPAGPSGRTILQDALRDRDLQELRLVANAVKHGEGSSYDDLKALRAAVVDPTRIENDWTVGPFSTFGVPLIIEPEDVRRYEAAVLRFWALDGTFWRKME
jgi:hypothetical protein